MGKEIKNKFNESINKIKDNINNIDEKDIKKENIEILEMDEARSGSKSSLLEFASLSSHEVPTERSEGEARSRKMIGLPNHFNLLVCEVPKRPNGAR